MGKIDGNVPFGRVIEKRRVDEGRKKGEEEKKGGGRSSNNKINPIRMADAKRRSPYSVGTSVLYSLQSTPNHQRNSPSGPPPDRMFPDCCRPVLAGTLLSGFIHRAKQEESRYLRLLCPSVAPVLPMRWPRLNPDPALDYELPRR
jgi:hypothetical protein